MDPEQLLPRKLDGFDANTIWDVSLTANIAFVRAVTGSLSLIVSALTALQNRRTYGHG